jgi:hypothetical protein
VLVLAKQMVRRLAKQRLGLTTNKIDVLCALLPCCYQFNHYHTSCQRMWPSGRERPVKLFTSRKRERDHGDVKLVLTADAG